MPPSTFTRGPFVLQADLDSLIQVAAIPAPEAVAFYAGRILEVLAAQALDDLGLPPHNTVLANLDVLEQHSLVPLPTRHAGHALRRMANDARHILRPLVAADATLAHSFVHHWISWYFAEFPFGPRNSGTAPWAAKTDGTLMAQLQSLLAHLPTSDVSAALSLIELQTNSPALAAIFAEAFLAAGRLDAAGALLQNASPAFPTNLRLLLLQGLFLSRTGKLLEAVTLLEPQFKRYPHDPEAAGILAGVYKRLWNQTSDPSWLQRSFDTYHAGWKASRETSDYLGTNAATTALLLGKREVSRILAQSILARITLRLGRLAARIPNPLTAMEYWAGATVAELHLLSGNPQSAQQTYRQLFAAHPSQTGNIQVTRGQAALIAQTLGVPDADFQIGT